MASVCSFLNLDFNLLPENALQVHSNKGLAPKYLPLSLFLNRVLRTESIKSYNSFLPNVPSQIFYNSALSKGLKIFRQSIRAQVDASKRPINKETKEFLDRYYQSQLQGLDELTGMDIMSRWFQ